MLPPHQRLRAGENRLDAADVELRLIINFKLSSPDRAPEGLQQPLRLHFLFMQGIIIDRQAAGIASPHGIRRQLGPVKTPLHLRILICIGIDAHPHADAGALFDLYGNLFQQLFVILPMRTIDEERVAASAAHNAARLPHRGKKLPADLLQDPVACCPPVALIQHVELIDIHHHGIHAGIRVMLIIAHGVAIEVFTIVKPRQRIPLGPADDIAVLIQLNRPKNSSQNHLLPRIGLGNKIDSSQRQAFHLRVLIRRHHDDRQRCRLRLLAKPLQDLDALHIREIQIEQNQAHGVGLCLNERQRLSAGLREHKLVAVLQHHAQNLAVDLLILHHQDGPFFSCCE